MRANKAFTDSPFANSSSPPPPPPPRRCLDFVITSRCVVSLRTSNCVSSWQRSVGRECSSLLRRCRLKGKLASQQAKKHHARSRAGVWRSERRSPSKCRKALPRVFGSAASGDLGKVLGSVQKRGTYRCDQPSAALRAHIKSRRVRQHSAGGGKQAIYIYLSFISSCQSGY